MSFQLQNHRTSNAKLFGSYSDHPRLLTATNFKKSRNGSITVLKQNTSGSGTGLMKNLLLPGRTTSNREPQRNSTATSLSTQRPRTDSTGRRRRRHSVGGTGSDELPVQPVRRPDDEEQVSDDLLEGEDSFLTGMTIRVEREPEVTAEETHTSSASSPKNMSTDKKRPGIKKAASFSIRGLRRRSSTGTTDTAESSSNTLTGSRGSSFGDVSPKRNQVRHRENPVPTKDDLGYD